MSALAICFVVAFSQPAGAAPKSGGPESTNAVCGEGKVAFHGKCVERDQCCEEGLCPIGTVFEFVKTPKCVPCPQAETESGASYCAAHTAADADRELNELYASLVKEFPSERRPLKEAEHAWVAFRDKLCQAQADTYKGGSMEREMFGRCLAGETRRQIDRLKELRALWAEGTNQDRKRQPSK